MTAATLTRDPETDEIDYRYTDNQGNKTYIAPGNHGVIITIEDEDGPFDPSVEVSFTDIPQLIATLAAILQDGTR